MGDLDRSSSARALDERSGVDKGSFVFLILFASGAIYAFALAALSSMAESRGSEFLATCRRRLVGSMALVTVAFLTSLTVFGNTRMPGSGYVAAGSFLSLLALILVAVAFSRVERRAKTEADAEER